jgi:hypothetical protein
LWIMDRRVHVYGKAKGSSPGAEAKASLKVAIAEGLPSGESRACGPKPRDLPVARLNTP